MLPRCARGLPAQASDSSSPPRPRIQCPTGISAARKPVPKMIVSTARSVPSAVTIARAVTSRIASVTSSTFGSVSAGYQRLEGRIRLQPIA